MKEYFLLENRQYEGTDKSRASANKGKPSYHTGIAIWHINEAYAPSGDKDKPMVALEDASQGSRESNPQKRRGSPGGQGPYYHRSGNTEFSDTSTPNNRSCEGEPQPWRITESSFSDNVMTFQYTQRKAP